ncbi:hypothetical protein PHYBLDRAFT_58353 [Phycomyces blakesleeanus NRRL 1555(-)]|uniref:Uncharacterized protein n=1 Tax=Phycomyces blakesleeanus (strain ATCC 8743b / DSM 1359 / FGSC 10004 / NBRC 33097 / NRRL 1555) TaxID=763407 RepID=A0A162V171_PHYB8|nr:hypothetical protein PHYBLDRAFT_58353 [Phycomyces blakesleeanus NRRL 1555(-)]OAD79303.1 hypothetical protein PHYBLDRAFT_58353 [Phycomyces blakesleeanus NRRL 1555(-)]|eukprot:XP_018297343.1 hypothetical protein PHYBLDRAFT_58353 [Phycomyces blakesleeanus NRRL 1555(-)]
MLISQCKSSLLKKSLIKTTCVFENSERALVTLAINEKKIWSGKSCLCLEGNDGSKRVFQKIKKRYKEKQAIDTVKQSGGGIMFLSERFGPLKVIKSESVNQDKYIDTLAQALLH